MPRPLVTAVIPTYNRRDDALIAVGTVVDQTYPADAIEILVVDDGGSDDTAEALAARFGARVRVLRKPNGGVSSARNHGLRAARGAYLALLDSDDEWRPTKLERQVEFLEARPDFGMVVTDIEQIDPARRTIDIIRRRRQLPVDGRILPHVLRDPMLGPSSVMLRRAVLDDVGGFDEGLRTAEDIDFHLRVARRWPIGLVEEPLTRYLRGPSGLSASSQSYRDYVRVVTRFLDAHADEIAPRDRDAALLATYARNAPGVLRAGEYGLALRYAGSGATRIRSRADAIRIGRLGAVLARTLAANLLRSVR